MRIPRMALALIAITLFIGLMLIFRATEVIPPETHIFPAGLSIVFIILIVTYFLPKEIVLPRRGKR